MSLRKWVIIASLMASAPQSAHAQIAGGTVLGITTSVLARVATGWSVRRTILGKTVYNDAKTPEAVGTIDDIIIAPDDSASFVIINAAKYLGLSSHLVAVPSNQLKLLGGNQLTLPGSTKDKLRSIPEFQYAR